MKNTVKTAVLLSLFAAAWCRGADPAVGFRCNFDAENELKHREIFGAVGTLRRTKFVIVDEPGAEDRRALAVDAKRSSAFLVFKVEGLDLKKYPYMRWRWRVVRRLNLPKSDAKDPDDQVCSIYVTFGSTLFQKCVGYRWEHNTRIGFSQRLRYIGRLVHAVCLRNIDTPLGEWVVEERDVIADYRKLFGEEPTKEFVITIGGNSQHSGSDTRAEIDYIEFRSAPAPKN